jgi:hypothetical protein
MMLFRVVKTALVNLLDDNSAGKYRVIGCQHQTENADNLLINNRLVTVYYSEGEFPKNAGRQRGDKVHNLTLNIDLSVSAMAKGDISVIENPTSTAIQKAAAIASIKDASEEADQQIDELIEYVWNVLMDARNQDIGLEDYDISSRWIDRIQKDTNLKLGDLVVKTANLKYTCRVMETVLGAIGNEPDTVVFDSTNEIGDTGGAGTIVENDNT